MSVLVGKDTNLIIQGITGRIGQVHAQRTMEYGVNLLCGTAPGKGGTEILGKPVYNTVMEAKAAHPEINTSLIFIPPMGVYEGAMEAIEANIPLVVIITEFVPVHDILKIVKAADAKGIRVIGPNTIGVISPGKGKVGVMPGYIYQPGHIGIISRSGTLTHEVSSNLTFAGYGQSTCICIGGDMIPGTTHTDALKLLKDDPDTLAVIILGEIGGTSEEDAAEYIREQNYPKPALSYIAGRQAPEGKKMGHAGAITSGNKGTAKSKIQALNEAGVAVAETTGRLLDLVRELDAEMNGALRTLTPISDPE